MDIAHYKISFAPPSVNAMYANVPRIGRVKTAAYKTWIKSAGKELAPIIPITARDFSVSIRLPQNMRGDIDNRVKAILDLLVTHKATPDDKGLQSLYVERCTDGMIEIEVSPYGGNP